MKSSLRLPFALTVLAVARAATAGPISIDTSAWVTFAQSGFAATTATEISLGTQALAGAVATVSSNVLFTFDAGTVLHFYWSSTPASGLFLSLPNAASASTNCIAPYGCSIYALPLLPNAADAGGPEFEIQTTATDYYLTLKNSYFGRIGFVAPAGSSVYLRDLSYTVPQQVPEPTTLALCALALLSLALMGTRGKSPGEVL